MCASLETSGPCIYAFIFKRALPDDLYIQWSGLGLRKRLIGSECRAANLDGTDCLHLAALTQADDEEDEVSYQAHKFKAQEEKPSPQLRVLNPQVKAST